MMPESRPTLIAMHTALALFGVFAALWFYIYNRYSVLHYHEQIQLFQLGGLYLRSYLARPGGLSGYAGSFLTQFYRYPVAGAVIIAGMLSAVVVLFRAACGGNIARLFIIPFIPATLLMASFVNTHFNMSLAVSILLVLAGFRCYRALPLPARYYAGSVLFTALYFVAAGASLLLPLLILVHELPFRAKQHANRGTYISLAVLIALSIALPWAARQLIYTVSIREAYFALTPWDLPFPTRISKALWLSFPALYLIWKLTACRVERWTITAWKPAAASFLLVIVATAGIAHRVYDRRTEILNRMACELQNRQWTTVTALGKDYPGKNRLACYFTNIALAESGLMPHQMFHYKQVGIAGLFLDWQLTYHSLWHLGEIYYRLGVIPEAEHCAFEALVASPKEPNAQTIRRLALTNIARRDSAAAAKYIGYFERSLTYRKWAQQQRACLASAMADASFQVPDMPPHSRYRNFFISHAQPDRTLLVLLQANPMHRMAFEYLMAYYMLQKDMERVQWCLDRFYANFGYTSIPAHYEEALLACKNAMQAGDEFYAQYPVSNETRKRFENYIHAFKAAQGSKRNFEQLERQFANTYWFYLHFVEPTALQKKDEQNRY